MRVSFADIVYPFQSYTITVCLTQKHLVWQPTTLYTVIKQEQNPFINSRQSSLQPIYTNQLQEALHVLFSHHLTAVNTAYET